MGKKLSYWERRSLKDKAASVNRAEDYLLKEQQKLYSQAAEEIQKEIEKLYQAFADQEDITLAEAKRWISGADFSRIDWQGMIKESQEHLSGKPEAEKLPGSVAARIEKQHQDLEAEMRLYSRKGRISYLELRKLEIDRKLLSLYDRQQAGIYDYLKSEFDDGYYRGIFNVQQRIGFGKDFVHPNERAVEKAILNRYDKRNYSKTLYAHCKNFSDDLRRNLTTGLIRGESLDKMASRIRRRMDVAYSAAKTLVRTETAYVFEKAMKESYEAAGAEWYEYYATLDSLTSEACRNLDGKHFKVKDAVTGKNYPPMHPNCRSTTVCWFPDEEEKKAATTRLAKDENGKYYEVPADMTYKQWRARYGPEEDIKGRLGKLLDTASDRKKPIGLGELPEAARLMENIWKNDTPAGKLLRSHWEEVQVINTKARKTQYLPATGQIRYHAEKSKADTRGEYASLWHEIGHRMDHLTGNRSELKIFRDAIISDSENLFQSLIDSGGYANIEAVYGYLKGKRGQDPFYRDIIDLLDGASGKRIIPGGSHSAEYWKRDHALEHEAYAHFFSAMMVNAPEKIAAMEQAFPKAWEIFKEVLKSGQHT
ncbi:MAG: minor capsid protein [Acetatifactor muris]|nr:minor capsid protein [Acetatifactor muris]